MQRATQKARWEFIDLMRTHVVKSELMVKEDMTVKQFAERLLYYGATLGRLAEAECNGHQTWDGKWDEAAAKRDESKEERIRKRVIDLCARFKCKPVFQGDPRGNTLKIQVPDGYTNDWGKEGICVPTS